MVNFSLQNCSQRHFPTAAHYPAKRSFEAEWLLNQNPPPDVTGFNAFEKHPRQWNVTNPFPQRRRTIRQHYYKTTCENFHRRLTLGSSLVEDDRHQIPDAPQRLELELP